jgi:hypothetical protein
MRDGDDEDYDGGHEEGEEVEEGDERDVEGLWEGVEMGTVPTSWVKDMDRVGHERDLERSRKLGKGRRYVKDAVDSGVKDEGVQTDVDEGENVESTRAQSNRQRDNRIKGKERIKWTPPGKMTKPPEESRANTLSSTKNQTSNAQPSGSIKTKKSDRTASQPTSTTPSPSRLEYGSSPPTKRTVSAPLNLNVASQHWPPTTTNSEYGSLYHHHRRPTKYPANYITELKRLDHQQQIASIGYGRIRRGGMYPVVHSPWMEDKEHFHEGLDGESHVSPFESQEGE